MKNLLELKKKIYHLIITKLYLKVLLYLSIYKLNFHFKKI